MSMSDPGFEVPFARDPNKIALSIFENDLNTLRIVFRSVLLRLVCVIKWFKMQVKFLEERGKLFLNELCYFFACGFIIGVGC